MAKLQDKFLTSQKIFPYARIAAPAALMLDIVYPNTAHRRAGGGIPLHSIDPEKQNISMTNDDFGQSANRINALCKNSCRRRGLQPIEKLGSSARENAEKYIQPKPLERPRPMP